MLTETTPNEPLRSGRLVLRAKVSACMLLWGIGLKVWHYGESLARWAEAQCTKLDSAEAAREDSAENVPSHQRAARAQKES